MVGGVCVLNEQRCGAENHEDIKTVTVPHTAIIKAKGKQLVLKIFYQGVRWI